MHMTSLVCKRQLVCKLIVQFCVEIFIFLDYQVLNILYCLNLAQLSVKRFVLFLHFNAAIRDVKSSLHDV